MTEKEEKVVELLNDALNKLITIIGKDVSSKKELELLESAVKLCHQIRSLQSKGA